MNLVRLTHDNLESEHICCAIANNNDCQISSKKKWLSERLDEGIVFLKGDVRGKCFIEYIPAENAWVPIDAEGFMYINCLWVSGQYKGHGYSNQLLQACIDDAKKKGKNGLVILSSKKKMGFLSDPKYMKYKKFIVADSAEPYFELLYYPFVEKVKVPQFRSQVKSIVHNDSGKKEFVIYYTNQCPFTAKYVPLLENIAKEKQIELKIIHIQSAKQAQDSLSPFTTFSLFYNGKFITHEIQSEKKFERIIEEYCK